MISDILTHPLYDEIPESVTYKRIRASFGPLLYNGNFKGQPRDLRKKLATKSVNQLDYSNFNSNSTPDQSHS